METRGQPTKLDKPCRTLDDGTTVTTGEHLIDCIRLGLDYQRAADSAGISRTTLHYWRLNAARHRATETQGGTLNPKERVLVDFLDSLEEAEAEAEASRLEIIRGAAKGGHRMVRTTVKYDKAGDVVETVETTEHLRPEWTAAAWFLERRISERYARRVEVTGAEGAPLVPPAEQAKNLEQSLADFQAGAATAQSMENDAAGAD